MRRHCSGQRRTHVLASCYIVPAATVCKSSGACKLLGAGSCGTCFPMYIQHCACRAHVSGSSMRPLAAARSTALGNAYHRFQSFVPHNHRQSRPLCDGILCRICRHCAIALHYSTMRLSHAQGMGSACLGDGARAASSRCACQHASFMHDNI